MLVGSVTLYAPGEQQRTNFAFELKDAVIGRGRDAAGRDDDRQKAQKRSALRHGPPLGESQQLNVDILTHRAGRGPSQAPGSISQMASSDCQTARWGSRPMAQGSVPSTSRHL